MDTVTPGLVRFDAHAKELKAIPVQRQDFMKECADFGINVLTDTIDIRKAIVGAPNIMKLLIMLATGKELVLWTHADIRYAFRPVQRFIIHSIETGRFSSAIPNKSSTPKSCITPLRNSAVRRKRLLANLKLE